MNSNFINEAIELASTSLCKKRHGALVVRGSRVIGRGINIDKTHPDWHQRQRFSYHAEVRAVKRSKGSVEGATIYSMRDGPWKVSRPCGGCIDRMRRLGIRSVVFVSVTTSPFGPFMFTEESL